MNEISCHGGCREDNRIWGLHDPKTGRLHRLSFSKSLMEMLAHKTSMTLRRWQIYAGERMDENDESEAEHGLFAIVSHNGLILRASLQFEIAKMLTDNHYRFIHKAFLAPMKG